ncbi:DM13 domain-containing protein [Coraliomargarita akajimensis]|uniref:Electron transfer DM13 n=1 Tax=Coraliomargarita akajimensis (strain DSM 45221 / IAM 15411 / JCM 23193 / KCTC 12865 / 04OKA010-24) TaxID=583355 RepID=D5EKI7_CORAD|nr:DM13 domain-containing protein [Coraliomargarita akajimensis]ADE53068.1 Electron transfer DM13 [Coraliomargarita akajimensis DSM 45221]
MSKSASSLFVLPILCLSFFGWPHTSVANSTSLIAGHSRAPGQFSIHMENLSGGATYYIERTETLGESGWDSVFSFEGDTTSRTWTDSDLPALGRAFYRILRDAYQESVGDEAELVTRHHGVSGTARIVNNRTIEIRDFNFDGQGLVVEIYLGTDSTYTNYISISGELVRATPYIDETLVLDVPAGTDIDAYTHISVWCVTAGVSFGDGVFGVVTAPE